MLMGLVLGLAIYNRVLLDFPLPLPLYKKLLGQAVGLRDLEEMQPMLGRSLRQLLHYEGQHSVEVRRMHHSWVVTRLEPDLLGLQAGRCHVWWMWMYARQRARLRNGCACSWTCFLWR
jgi:hypothetical protein